MNCLFCSNKIESMIENIFGGHDGNCKKCKARFYFNDGNEDEVTIWAFDFVYKNIKCLCLYSGGNTKIVMLTKIVATLHGPSFLTPNNIIQKMPTIMVFG
jgi:hypothetical protein